MDPIFGTMLGDPGIMASLFGLLGRLKPLDCMLAGYFSRVLTGLLLRRAREVLRYLQVCVMNPCPPSARGRCTAEADAQHVCMGIRTQPEPQSYVRGHASVGGVLLARMRGRGNDNTLV